MMVWLSKMGISSSQKDHLSFFCQEWRKGSKGTSYVIIGTTLKFLGCFKRRPGNCARCVQGPGMDEGVLITLECPGYMPLTARCGSLTYIKMKGPHGFLLLRVMKVML